jgi:hypothetical protein
MDVEGKTIPHKHCTLVKPPRRTNPKHTFEDAIPYWCPLPTSQELLRRLSK